MRGGIKAALLGVEGGEDPYGAYARLRGEGAVVRVALREGLDCWVVTRYAEARAVLEDRRFSRDPRVAGEAWREADRGRPLEDGADLGVHLLTREPPDHTRLRRLVGHAFRHRRAERYRPRIQQLADELLDQLLRHDQADLVAGYAYPLATTVICEILGLPAADGPLFRQWTSNALPGQPTTSPATYLHTAIADKRRTPADDLLTELIAATDQGRMSETELQSMTFLLIVAGHEGSVALIANSVVSLLRHPDQIALLERPDDTALDELFRYDGPMELAAWRFPTEPVEIGGVRIPAGAPVMIALAAAHHDDRHYPRPDHLDLTRAEPDHLGFGHGLHYCVGAPLARAEADIALKTLFRRAPGLTLAVPHTELKRQPSLLVRGLHELPVRFTRRGLP
ncbi:cytochrome P450 [Actinocorallia lasiicapitis]